MSFWPQSWTWASRAGPPDEFTARTPSSARSLSPSEPAFQEYDERVQDSLYLEEAQASAEERFQDYIYLRFAQPESKAAAMTQRSKSIVSTTTGGSSGPGSSTSTVSRSAAPAPRVAAPAPMVPPATRRLANGHVSSRNDENSSSYRPQETRPSQPQGSQPSMPVKNTFIHYDDRDSEETLTGKESWCSAPAALLQGLGRAVPLAQVKEATTATKSGAATTSATQTLVSSPALAPAFPLQSTFGNESQPHSAMRSEEQLPVKNTFIHYDDPDSPGKLMAKEKWSSAPPDMLHRQFQSKYQAMEQTHTRGDCKPCAYYLYKADGCRRGSACDFCHFCDDAERKKRKKEKEKRKKEVVRQKAA